MAKLMKVLVRSESLSIEMARRNVSQNGLARALHISSGYVSQLLSGARSPSPELRQEIQNFLKIDDFDLLFRLEPVVAEQCDV
jgi:transcriptional regulator with XRE-family HTH domain